MKGRIIFDVEGTAVSPERRADLKIALRKTFRDYVNSNYNLVDWDFGAFHSYTCFEIPDVDELMKALYDVTTAVIGQDRHNVTVTVEVTEDDA